MAHLRRHRAREGGGNGAGLPQLLAVRRTPLAGRRAQRRAAHSGRDAAAHEALVPARQPLALQPQVLPVMASALRRVRAASGPAARRDRGACRRGVSSVSVIAGGLALAVASAVAIAGGYALQHSSASRLPPLTLRRPLHSLLLLVRSGPWALGFVAGIVGWVLYVVAL